MVNLAAGRRWEGMMAAADEAGVVVVVVDRGGRGLVLIHGAAHSAACWDPTVADLASRAPDLRVLPVDLPGHGAAPGDLRTLTVGQCVDAVVEEIERARLDEVVLVAHSMGGLTAPGVVARLGQDRVVRLVLIAALVPPAGGSVLDTLRGPVRWHVARAHRRATPRPPPPRALARWLFCNGMTRQQRGFVLEQLCAESTVIPGERVDANPLPASVPTTWILTRRDRMVRPSQQRAFIDNLGGVDEIVEVDTCHDIMVSEPAKLGSLLAERSVS